MRKRIFIIVAFFIVCFSLFFVFLLKNKNQINKDNIQVGKNDKGLSQVTSGEENKKQEENKIDNDALPVGPAGTKDGGYHPIRMEDIEYLENNKSN